MWVTCAVPRMLQPWQRGPIVNVHMARRSAGGFLLLFTRQQMFSEPSFDHDSALPQRRTASAQSPLRLPGPRTH